MESKLGVGTALDVEVRLLVEGVSRNNFNQDKHDHLLDSTEIDRLALAAAEDFIRSNYHSILKGEQTLTEDELSGVRMVLGLNATQFAEILGIPKSTLSKMLKGTLKIKRPEAILVMERLITEVQEPRYWREYLTKKKHDRLRSA